MGDIDFKLRIKKQDSGSNSDPPPFPTQEIQTEKLLQGGLRVSVSARFELSVVSEGLRQAHL